MLVTYFDEVKFQAANQRFYWIGGIAAPAESIWRLEQQVSEISREIFGTPDMSRATEFHASDIFHRKRNFKEWADPAKRIDVIKRLLTVLNSEANVAKIYVRLEPGKMIATDYEHMAFMYFIERVEMHLQSNKSPGILIGDRENDQVSGVFAEDLSKFRSKGTPYNYGVKLTHLIDTVHFTNSHHSRMLQLADLYVWSVQLCAAECNEVFPRADLVKFIREQTNILSAARWKEWPTPQSWLQV
jgi:hypothetical protein